MAFERKVWMDREVEHPNRRLFTPVDGAAASECWVERAEGLVYEEGDAFDAATMNNLEERIESAVASTKKAADAERLGGQLPAYYATASGLSAHVGNKNNPHGVTASQVGALPAAGGSLTGALRVENDSHLQFWGSENNPDGSAGYNWYAAVYPGSGYMVLDTRQIGWTCRDMETGGLKPIYASNTTGPSSRRYKQSIEDMHLEDARRLLTARVCDFAYTKQSGFDDGKRHCGLIAEELEQIDDRFVYRNTAGEADGINYTGLVPVLLKLVQAQQQEVDELARRLAALEGGVEHAL